MIDLVRVGKVKERPSNAHKRPGFQGAAEKRIKIYSCNKNLKFYGFQPGGGKILYNGRVAKL